MNTQRQKTHSGREFKRFVEHVGSLKIAAAHLDITPDMLSKLRAGERKIMQDHIWGLNSYKGFTLSLRRLFDLDRTP